MGHDALLGLLRTSVRVRSLAQAAEVATRAVAASGPDADRHLWMDVRPDRVVLTVQSLATASVTRRDIDLARRISAIVRQLGLTIDAEDDGGVPRSVQVLEIAIDALDIASIRPFWEAVMGYGDEAGKAGPEDVLVDPVRQGPAIWSQQMDAPRPQRNRIHLDPPSRTTRRRTGSGRRWPPAGTLVSDRWRQRSGSSPTPRATKPASRPGRAETRCFPGVAAPDRESVPCPTSG